MTESDAKLEIEGKLEAIGYEGSDGMFFCNSAELVVGDRLLLMDGDGWGRFTMFLKDVLSVDMVENGMVVTGTSSRLFIARRDPGHVD